MRISHLLMIIFMISPRTGYTLKFQLNTGYILQDMIRGRTVRCNSLGWHCHMIHCVGKHMEEFLCMRNLSVTGVVK
ncbi:hypothetical protein YC2023_091971 [Brassica napus]|nr:unnamed protein product [Brassica napus]